MAYTLVPTELIVDGAITSAKLDTNIAISGTLGVTGEVTLATHLVMGDNDKIKIGTGGDLEIYHDGSNSYISNSTGNIYLGDTNGAVHIQAKLNEESIVASADGAVTLYHDNSAKLATASGGVTVTGTLTATTLAGTLSTAAQPNITSVGTLTGLTTTGDINFGDNDKAVFGAGSDLQIYHDGSNSYIDDSGTGGLIVRADNFYLRKANDVENMIIGSADGAVTLYHDNASKLATSSAGVTVTGTLVSDSLTVDTTTLVVDASNNRVGIGTSSPAGSGLHIKKDTSSTTNELLRLSNSAGSTTDGVKIVMEVANTSGNGGQIGVVRDGGSFNPYMFFSTSSGVGSSPTERMRIDSSGKCGIGTTNPSKLLHVQSDTNYEGIQIKGAGHKQLTIESTSSSKQVLTTFTSASQNMSIGLDTDNAFIFHSGTASAERMRILSSGNVLIGATSDVNSGSIFQVSGNASGGNGAITFMNSADNGPALSCFKTPTTTSSTARFIQFYADSGNTPMGGISGNGASNAQFVTLSDERDKENIIPVNNVLDKLMNLNVVSFDWKKNDEHVKAGFIAQNVEKYFPEYIVENVSNEDAEARKGTTGGMSAGYIAVLTKAIQEQQTQIDALQSEINELKNS